MTEALSRLLTELENFGAENDASISDRPRRMLNITRDTGEFLSLLVRATGARRVLEIGTSSGYSTLWLAEAVSAIGGQVTTVELSDFKINLAATTFSRSDLSPVITQLHADAGEVLAAAGDEAFDFVFLDSERPQYAGWWPELRRVLRRGGLLVVDNATSHPTELAPLVALVEADDEFVSCLVPVGNGEFLATRSA